MSRCQFVARLEGAGGAPEPAPSAPTRISASAVEPILEASHGPAVWRRMECHKGLTKRHDIFGTLEQDLAKRSAMRLIGRAASGADWSVAGRATDSSPMEVMIEERDACADLGRGGDVSMYRSKFALGRHDCRVRALRGVNGYSITLCTIRMSAITLEERTFTPTARRPWAKDSPPVPAPMIMTSRSLMASRVSLDSPQCPSSTCSRCVYSCAPMAASRDSFPGDPRTAKAMEWTVLVNVLALADELME